MKKGKKLETLFLIEVIFIYLFFLIISFNGKFNYIKLLKFSYLMIDIK